MGRPRSYDENDIVGKTFISNQNQEYTVVKFTRFVKGGKALYLIRFTTGYEYEARRDHVLAGEVSDRTNMTNLKIRVDESEFIGYTGVTNGGDPFTVISFDGRIDRHLRYNVRFDKTGNIKSFSKTSIIRGTIKDPAYTEGMIGYRGVNNQGASFEVIKFGIPVNTRRTYTVRFDLTGYTKDFLRHYILSGTIRDPYHPTYYGVACCGLAKTSTSVNGRSKDLPEYSIWTSIIERCYNINSKAYKYYGAKGVHVSDRWLCYEYFVQDLPLVPNYDLWKMYPGIYNLDKDILQPNIINKVYSLETCIFISSRDNTIERQKRANCNSSGYMGIFQQKSGNYFVRVGGDYFGTFTDPIAAANAYNDVARFRQYPEEYLNDVPFMDRFEYNQYRAVPCNGRRVMCYILERQNYTKMSDPCQLKEMCKIVEH